MRLSFTWLVNRPEGSKDVSIYLRKGIAYVPTIGRIPRAYSVIDEPVDVVAASDTAELRRAIHRTIARGNPTVPTPPRERKLSDWALLRLAGVKSLATFNRGLRIWNLSDHGGVYRIVGHEPGSHGGWVPDPDNVITLPPDATLDEVVDRAIAIVQESAKEKPEPRRRKGSKPTPDVVAPPSSSPPPDNPRLALPKDYVHLADAERNDELGDFLEWIANCEPKDEKDIRAEIKRLFYDFGDRWGGDAFSAALDRALAHWPRDRQTREAILRDYEAFTHGDPDRVAAASPIAAALPLVGLRTAGETPHDPRDAKLARYLSLFRRFRRWWRGR